MKPSVAKPATADATANELMLLARYYEMQVRDRATVDVETLSHPIIVPPIDARPAFVRVESPDTDSV